MIPLDFFKALHIVFQQSSVPQEETFYEKFRIIVIIFLPVLLNFTTLYDIIRLSQEKGVDGLCVM